MIVVYTTEREYPWGTLRSTNASKAKVVLGEKSPSVSGRASASRRSLEEAARDARQASPRQGAWIENEGFVVYDSSVINEYLEERYPEPPLLPSGPIARARARMLENFGDEAILVGALPRIWMPWFGGKTIPKNSVLWAMLASANGDPERFPNPDTFDIERRDNDHLAFGGGPHFCLGYHLAQLEARAAIGTLVRRFDHLRLESDAVDWGRSLFRVPARLSISFRLV